jgi:hypothetical protein
MKKRNFVTILMVAVGLFVSISLFAVTSASSSGGWGGGHTTGSVSGVYVPD